MLVEDKKTRPGHYLSFSLLLIAAVASLLPLYWMLVTALQQPTLTVTFPSGFLPTPQSSISDDFWSGPMSSVGPPTAWVSH